jgi:hypothetical protein
MTNEILKIIIGLCSVTAGDTNSMSSTVSQVDFSQKNCHEFYSRCLKVNTIDICMVARPRHDENVYAQAIAHSRAGIWQEEPEQYGPLK